MEYLRLMRISALPTLCSNVLTAYFLACIAAGGSPPVGIPILLLSTCGAFYLAGMVLNDFFDAKLDAVERPERPIPSGRISRLKAGLLGGALLLAGIMGVEFCARLSESNLIRPVGLILATLIVVYDVWFKRVPILGPATMGYCRFFNILFVLVVVNAFTQISVTTFSGWENELRLLDWPVFYAFGILAYIFGLTVVSSYETGEADKRLPFRKRASILIALFIALLGLAFCFAPVWGRTVYGDEFGIMLSFRPLSEVVVDRNLSLEHLPWSVIPTLAFSLIPFILLARPSWTLLARPTPETVRRWVGTALSLLILIDATCCLVYVGPLQAGLILAFYPVAIFLRRIVSMT